MGKMQKLSVDMEADKGAGKSFSLSALNKAYSGSGSIMRTNNAEMKVVISGVRLQYISDTGVRP